jgi:hypothetical protein
MKFSNVFWRVIGLFSWEHSSKDIGEFHVTFLLGYFHETTRQKTFPIKMLHEALMKITQYKSNVIWNSSMSFDKFSHENNPIKMLLEILQCLLTSALMKNFYWVIFMRALVKRHLRISCNIFLLGYFHETWSKDIWEFHVTFLLGNYHETTGQKTLENFM